MEAKKQSFSSSSASFSSDLFGSKDSSPTSPSSEIFGSIFSPSSKFACGGGCSQIFGKEYLRSEEAEKKQSCGGQISSTKPGSPDSIRQGGEGEVLNMPKKDVTSFFQEERAQPCHLSSSIYYGGQEVYYSPKKTQNNGYSTSSNDGGEEDESDKASRGNWWQGSLYY